MRKYRSADGKVATLTKNGIGVIAEVGSTLRMCRDFAEAVEWMTAKFGCGWCRVH